MIMELTMDSPVCPGMHATPASLESSARLLAGAAVSALIDEATLTPKPGLVDLRGQGSHRDMDWRMMCRSAQALQPAFYAMALAAQHNTNPQALREDLGRIGREGEATMLQTTGGVNTHRGAIWTLGLLVGAAAQDPSSNHPAAVAMRAANIARLPDRFAPPVTGNKGEAARAKYAVGGARTQARKGFPQIIHAGLPRLRHSRRQGDNEETARLNALLAIMAELDDTCILSRGGSEALMYIQSGAARILDCGGVGRLSGRSALLRLGEEAAARNISPGGSADLLAAALFLDKIELHLPG